MTHKPVLQKEVLEYLDPKPNQNFIDCTVGQGGHSLAILEKTGPNGKILGIDQDPKQIENCRKNTEDFKTRIILENSSYTKLKEIAERLNFQPAQGILLDLGMSSWQLEESGRGFSFLKDEELDMRFSPKENFLTSKEIINRYPEKELERIFAEYGEEKYADKIARKIVEIRQVKEIASTFQLVEAIKSAIPRGSDSRIHFATRVFQALRIAVNGELGNLQKVLSQAVEVLNPGGRLAVISFHSLEDRIVKNYFKALSKESFEILTKKPITADKLEIINNPRARSAKMRVAQKL